MTIGKLVGWRHLANFHRVPEPLQGRHVAHGYGGGHALCTTSAVQPDPRDSGGPHCIDAYPKGCHGQRHTPAMQPCPCQALGFCVASVTAFDLSVVLLFRSLHTNSLCDRSWWSRRFRPQRFRCQVRQLVMPPHVSFSVGRHLDSCSCLSEPAPSLTCAAGNKGRCHGGTVAGGAVVCTVRGVKGGVRWDPNLVRSWMPSLAACTSLCSKPPATVWTPDRLTIAPVRPLAARFWWSICCPTACPAPNNTRTTSVRFTAMIDHNRAVAVF